MSSLAPVQSPEVCAQLARILGTENVVTDETERRLLSTDMSMLPHEIADLVIKPANTEELAAALEIAARAGMAIVPRGGGMSYTRGYTPERQGSLLVDTRRMNRILEIKIGRAHV